MIESCYLVCYKKTIWRIIKKQSNEEVNFIISPDPFRRNCTG